MGIILFLVDTSASMSQRTFLGTNLIDIGKGAVETFIKLRQRDQGSRTDRYMLMTSEETGAIKAGWKENLATFMAELKNLQATGLTNLGSSLKQAFDLLNLYRLQSGIDNYGMGRNPFYLDPAMVICITDGGKYSSPDGVNEVLELPMTPRTPGDELTKEPFRWDQRLFSLLLKFPGSPHGFDKQAGVIADTTNEYSVTPMCEVTGGRSYIITSPKSLSNVLDSLVQKFQMGVVINFEKIGGPDKLPEGTNPASGNQATENDEGKPNVLNNHLVKPTSDSSGNVNQTGNDETSGIPLESNMVSRNNTVSPLPPTVQNSVWYSCRRLIYIKTNPKVNSPVGHWPIPESFWPEHSMAALEPRDADPTVLFSCVNFEPMVMDLLPFDKYELERSPLTQYILENVKPIHCWQTYISGSGKNSELGYPFGYLKASVNFNTVNLFVMPYNYPILIPLLEELFKVLKLNPTPKWKQMFDKYLSDLPSYYVGPLRAALRRMGANANMLIPEPIDGSLNYNITSYLKKLRQQAKVEADKLLSSISKKALSDQGRAASQNKTPQSPTNHVQSPFSSAKATPETVSVTNLPESKEIPNSQKYKNPFDIKRTELLDQLARMRINFFHTAPTATRLQDQDSRHSVAIGQMGNYQDYLKQTNPLREIDPGMNRAHMFGNPFKLAKDQPMMVDEADVVNEAVAGVPSRKRRDSRSPPPSLRDKRRKGEMSPVPPGKRNLPNTPPMSPQENVNQSLPPVVHPPVVQPPIVQPPVVQPPVQPVVSVASGSATTDDKATINNVHLNHNAKLTPAIVPNKKRKLPETEGLSEQRKPTKQSVNPQLRKLQQLHHNKIHGQGSSAFNTPLSTAKDKMESSKDISSILRNACMPANSSTSKTIKTGIKTENIFSNNHSEDVLGKGNKFGSHRKAMMKNKALRRMYEDNSKLRQLICKEIRTPGQDHGSIFGHLEKVQGTDEKKSEFTRLIIDEASKFKKRELVERLNTWLTTLEQSAVQNSRNHIRKNVNR